MLVIEFDKKWNAPKFTYAKLDFRQKIFMRLVFGFFAVTYTDHTLYGFVTAIEKRKIGWYP